MSEFRAVVSDLLVAHPMHVFHVLPPLVVLPLSGYQLEETLLSQVFNQNVFALDVGTLVVHRAISTVREALLAFEFGVTAGASPRDDTRGELSLRT